MVDEYQDINPVQYKLLRLIFGERGNICVVGDSDQAIYAFRGADVENFMNFQRDFLCTKLISLTENYRSTGVILNASNSLIKNNIKRIDKDLHSAIENGRKITVVSLPDDGAEGEIIVSEIEERMVGTSRYQHYHYKGTDIENERGFGFSDFTVLIRTNAQVRAIEELFIRSGIPYQIIGGTYFLERHEIKDVLAYLRIILNPSDSISLERIINRPPRGIGGTTVTVIADYANRHGLSLYEAMRTGSGLTGHKRKKINEFVALIEHFIELKESLTADELLNIVVKNTGLKEFHSEKFDSLLSLENFSVAYQDIQPPASAQSFIRDISLLTPYDAYDPRADRVTIMTMHMAKGLEFRTVFIAGVEDGLIPFTPLEKTTDKVSGDFLMEADGGIKPPSVHTVRRCSSLTGFTFNNDTDIEEERRLFYVGMTRAKEELFLLHSRKRFLYGQKLSPSPSPFIKEIPEEFIENRVVPERIIKTKEKPQTELF